MSYCHAEHYLRLKFVVEADWIDRHRRLTSTLIDYDYFVDNTPYICAKTAGLHLGTEYYVDDYRTSKYVPLIVRWGRDQQGVTLMQSGLRCHSAIATLVITIKRRQGVHKRGTLRRYLQLLR
jgi:hypothetical protein